MPDYLITMDSGEKVLAHHGVTGMKWGEWNAETAARYAGGTRSKRTIKYTAKAEKHRQAANEFRRSMDSTNATAIKARAKRNKYDVKSARAEQGSELFRNANQKRADRFARKADKQDSIYDESTKQASKLSKKYEKADRKATKYEVKAYKSDVYDAGGYPDRKVKQDLKKGRITLDEAKSTTKNKAENIIKNASSEPKWKQNGYNSEAEHREAIERAKKMLGDPDAVGYYDKPVVQEHQESRKKNPKKRIR